MAVYTSVNNSELNKFLQQYNLGNLISFKGILDGIENSNYVINTEKGKFILTLFEKRVNPNDLPFFMNLQIHLSQNEFMEDNRDRISVIVAGYEKEMDLFITSNPGLKSRFTKYSAYWRFSICYFYFNNKYNIYTRLFI